MAGALGEVGKLGVKGQKELERAFLDLRRDVLIGLKPAILAEAEDVRRAAVFQVTEGEDKTTNIGVKWSQVRIGVTPQLAYIAPKIRRSRGGLRRPNLAPKLAAAYEDAANQEADAFLARINELVTLAAAKNDLL